MTMDNVFSKAAGASTNRKFSHKTKVALFSPSFGVRHGFIKDPNWPPASFPSEGLATSRRFRRVPASFEVRIDQGETIAVNGNLSSGGVMFVTSIRLTSEKIEVKFGDLRAEAEVIACEGPGPQFICRARFTDLDAGGEIWFALMKTY